MNSNEEIIRSYRHYLYLSLSLSIKIFSHNFTQTKSTTITDQAHKHFTHLIRKIEIQNKIVFSLVLFFVHVNGKCLFAVVAPIEVRKNGWFNVVLFLLRKKRTSCDLLKIRT